MAELEQEKPRAAIVSLDRAWIRNYGASAFEDALTDLSREARVAIQAHQVAISYIPDGDFQRAVHTHSFSERYEAYNTYDVAPTGVGIWSLLVRDRRPVRMSDVELKSHPRWKNFSDMRDERGLEHPEMRGWLAVPILGHQDRFLGVLQASDKMEGDFSELDLLEFQHVAKLIAPTFELQHANEQLHRRTQELEQARHALEQSNMELKQFAYVASHDLQAPLRGIAGFAQFLQMDYGGKLDDKADRYIGNIVTSATKMQSLIHDLLTFSRVENRARPFEEVALSRVVEEVREILEPTLRDAGGTVTYDELPTVVGDGSQLTLLLQNLIENGIKYHRRDVAPSVHVHATRADDEHWQISVRDNGIGIAARQHEKIFQLFRRLHTEKAYPGTGIGLSICRRIVSRHNGEIWLESDVGRGSTFHFTLRVGDPPHEDDPTAGLPRTPNKDADR